ncbi:response regulator transcription factor [Campylobacter sp. CCUG 57310]|uniref:response regulator transcription factor n=1 Tax=Campylobacter sp. CCUG 57310 TaxID=2517362 RepID=UPI001563499D|nr:response regulator transcription factor [Campylobacter sp. CCUG 57310]QKF91846.1 two-component system response regulator [Campylobacter sp. CCUG 57310]
MRILLLEDDFNYRESVSEYLQGLGYEVDEAPDGQVACDKIANNFYHLLILDIKVPHISGHEVIKYAKDIGLETPIMITTSLVDINDMAVGYELGCNEYLKKPFELAELKFRVNELMRKYHGTDDKNLLAIESGFVFDFIKKQLKFESNVIDISAKEIMLIECLLYHKNSFVSLETLRAEVWGDKDVDPADVRMHVRKIRQKTKADFIVSSRGLGYKINVKKP